MKVVFFVLLVSTLLVKITQAHDYAIRGNLISPSVLKWLDKFHLKYAYNVTTPNKQRVWLTTQIFCEVENFEPHKCFEMSTNTSGGKDTQNKLLFSTVNVDMTINGVRFQGSYKVYTVTYATDLSHQGFCLMSASAFAHGFSPNVLGQGRQAEFDRGFTTNERLWSVQRLVEEIYHSTVKKELERTVILYVDAYDILFTNTVSALVKKLLRAQTSVIFGGEKGCCGVKEELAWKRAPCAPKWMLPDTKTATPYLNAGSFVGFVSETRDLLARSRQAYHWFLSDIEAKFGPIEPVTGTRGPFDPYMMAGDQQLLCDALPLFKYGQTNISLGIDYKSSIFLNAYRMQMGREIVLENKHRRVVYNPEKADCMGINQKELGLLCESSTQFAGGKRFPVTLHFNGPASDKDRMIEVARQMHWPRMGQDVLWNKTLFSVLPGKYITVKEQCDRHLVDFGLQSIYPVL